MNLLGNYLLPVEKVYSCEMKNRAQMERDIEENLLGWWHDNIPGRTVSLRQATKEDMKTRWVRTWAPQNPEAYMVELHDRGCLILKRAIRNIKEEANEGQGL